MSMSMSTRASSSSRASTSGSSRARASRATVVMSPHASRSPSSPRASSRAFESPSSCGAASTSRRGHRDGARVVRRARRHSDATWAAFDRCRRTRRAPCAAPRARERRTRRVDARRGGARARPSPSRRRFETRKSSSSGRTGRLASDAWNIYAPTPRRESCLLYTSDAADE